MDFFDKLGANLTNAGRTVSQKTKNFSDMNSLKREIANEKRNIQLKYAEIGQLYFEKFNNDPGCDFFTEVDAILNSQRRIEDLEAEIEEVQNRRPELIPIPDTPRPQNTGYMKPSAMVCMQCGQTYDTTQAYCSACGTKLTPQYPTGAAASAAAPVVSETSIAPEAPYSRAVPTQDAPASVTPNPMHTGNSVPDAPAEKPAEDKEPAVNNNDVKPVTEGRFCPNCGTKAADDSRFCAHCGEKLG